MLTSKRVKALAAEAGFDLCGITAPDVIPEARRRFEEWLKAGHHGEMHWIARNVERRTDPRKILESARSVIMLGLNYYNPDSIELPGGKGRVSNYARGRDYHKVIAKQTKHLLKLIEREMHETGARVDGELDARWFVDFGPFLERSYAEQAGLGFIGKNGLLINEDFGSWFFLAEIITNLELDLDTRDPIRHGHCGACRACIDACPTDAILSPRVVDSRRCISYLTIERPSEIPDDLAAKFSGYVFGCDICQTACPYNRESEQTAHRELGPESGVGEFLDLDTVLALGDREAFLELTAGTPLTRPKREGLQRNARIVRDNERRGA